MIKKLFTTVVLLVLLQSALWAQVTTNEAFETATVGSTSFTSNGQTFTITAQQDGPFSIYSDPGLGWNGTAADNQFIDNSGHASSSNPVGFTIGTVGAVPFKLNSVWLYLALSNADVNTTGSLTIVGKLGGVTKFTANSSGSFNNTNTAVDNGFTQINMSTFGTGGNNLIAVDQLVFTTTNNFQYVSVDAFNWTTIAPLSATATATGSVSCNGGSNGTASVTVSGGVSPYTYSWSPSGGTGASASGLAAGTYSVKVTDAASSTVTNTVSVSQPAAITATTTQTNVACNGGNNGIASVNASGGTGSLTYVWAPSGGTAATASGLTFGTYTCTIKDANLCSITKAFTITQPAAITATTTQTNVACNGGNNGIASVNASGGTGSFTYAWAPSGGTAATASGLTFGTYTCTIKDANLCSITKAFTITQPAAITATTTQTNVACNGGSNAVAAVSTSGGTGSLTYAWAPSGGTAATSSGLTFGTYTCTITDGNSCSITKAFTITQPTVLNLTSASQTNVSSFGGNDGAASVNNATGGTSGYTYSWAPGNPTGNGTTSVTGLTAGTWTCTVTDVNNCSTSQTFTITQPAAGPAAALNFDGVDDAITITDSPSLDISQQITLEAWVYATSGSGTQDVICKSNCTTSNTGYIFPRTDDGWNNFVAYFFIGGGWQTLSAPYAGLNQWHHLAATYDGSYIRLYQDGVLAATSSLIAGSIAINSNPLSIGTQPGCGEFFGGSLDEARVWNRALCQGEIQNNMNGELHLPQNGLVAYYKFDQGLAGANNSSITTALDSSSNANNGTLANFALVGSTSNWIAPGAVITGSYSSTFVGPVVSVNSATVCSGTTTTLTASGATTYTWSTTETTASISPSPTVTTNYTVTGADANNCMASATSTVTVNTLPTLTVTASTNTICIGGTSTLTASGATTYTWSNTGATGASINPSPIVTTQYTVTGTDGNGCMNSDTLSVIVENCTTGIEHLSNNNSQVSVYPNPNHGSFMVTTPANTNVIMVTDILGNEILSINPSSTITPVNLSAQPNGIYLIKVINNGMQTVKRIIINN